MLIQKSFRLADQRNHVLIAFTSVIGKGEQAVMHQHNPFQFRPVDARGHLADLSGQYETRHDIGQDQHLIAVDRLKMRFTIRRIADCNHGIGMGMIDKPERNNGMQNRFNGWIGRLRIEHGSALGIDHIGIGE